MTARWRAALGVLLSLVLAGSALAQNTDPRVDEADRLVGQGYERFWDGQDQEAEALYLRALSLYEAALGPKAAIPWSATLGLVRIYLTRNAPAQAVPLLDRQLKNDDREPEATFLLAMAHDWLGHRALAQALYRRAAQNEADYDEDSLADHYQTRCEELGPRGAPLLERALKIRERHYGADSLIVVDTLNLLGKTYLWGGAIARAEPLLLRALRIEEQKILAEGSWVDRGERVGPFMDGILVLVQLYQKIGAHARAESHRQRALHLCDRALRGTPGFPDCLAEVAKLDEEMGVYARAESQLQQALRLRERTADSRPAEIANALRDLGAFHQRMGAYGRAEPLLQRALQIRDKESNDTAQLIKDLDELALLYQETGVYSRAEPLLQRALSLCEKICSPDTDDLAQALSRLGELHRKAGAPARAEPFASRALEIFDRLNKRDDSLDQAWILRSTALLYRDMGALDRAEPLLARALRRSERGNQLRNRGFLVDVLHDLAALYQEMGAPARAEPLLRRALQIDEEISRPGDPSTADLLQDLARTLGALGKNDLAEPMLTRALKIRTREFGPHHPLVAESLQDLADLLSATGRRAEAVPLYRRALGISENLLRSVRLLANESGLAGFLRWLRDQEERIYSLLAAPGDGPAALVSALALQAALLRKGRSADEAALTSRVIYRGLGPEDQKRFEQLRALRTEFARLTLLGPRKLTTEFYRQRLQELATQADQIEEDLAHRSARLRAQRDLAGPDRIIKQVAATLPRDAALVEIVAFTRRGWGLPPSGPARYHALVLFRDGQVGGAELGPAPVIDATIGRLLAALSTPGSAVAAYLPLAQELYQRVVAPVRPLLGGRQELLLAPEGQLSLLPFAVLHDGHGYLFDAYRLTYLTSSRDLLRRDEGLARSTTVTLLADPAFAGPVSRPGAQRGAQWQRLPGTRQEAEAIQGLLPAARLLLGSDASKQALLNLAAPGILHVATHGWFLADPTPPTSGARGLGIVGELAHPDRTIPAPPDPLLRSALVLAGAEAMDPAQRELAGPGPGQPEGLATALEIAGMNLWGTQLVVLSACETGRGEVQIGQGVYGLRRAVMVAGAETLVTSLWKVDDQTTRDLMEHYYRRLLAGSGRVGAMQEAMQKVRAQKPHPYYWAPFIVLGRGDPLRGIAGLP